MDALNRSCSVEAAVGSEPVDSLGSTMVTCSASVLGFGELRIFSTLPWTRILKCLVFVLTQNGEECAVDASVSVVVALLASGNFEIPSRVSRGWRK